MRTGMILSLFMLILIPCDARGSEVSAVRIIEAGIYTARTVKHYDLDGSALQTVDSIRLLESTAVIPATKEFALVFAT